ncbi:glutathione S-transferase T2-like [Helianthus annuus]|uniref:glutathione S-transferase T2-like n=1 Tax=Helianthus annuus TaxID=4232 RepID=UPI000B906D1F|nr:glutathione S-transferase T2-like [Helianthus annuus]
MEPNQFGRFSANVFAAFQNSPNVFANMQQTQTIQHLMMHNPFNIQPVQPEQPSQPIRTEPDEDVVEVVPETQPQKNKRKKASKLRVSKANRPNRTETYGRNNQTGEGFWKSVLAKFLELMEQGPYRDVDSVSSKWRKMSGFVNKFSEEYNKIYSSGRRSGMSDEDVFKKALDVYKTNHHTTFAHVRAWEVMRTAPKWAPVPNEVEMAKRQRTSESGSYSAGGSDARCHINLNDDAEFDEEEYAVKEAERPPGRDKSKKEAASKKEKQKVDLKMEEFMTQFKTYTEVKAQKARAKEQAIEEKSRVAGEKLRLSDDKVRLKEWEILTMDVDSYPEPKRSTLKKLQNDIMKKHQSG